jgi:hypothetical protein
VTGELRKLHNVVLHDLDCSPTIVQVIKLRRMRWAGHVVRKERERHVQVLVGKTKGKRPLGRPRRRWEDNIKMGFEEVGCGEWTGLSWLRIDRWRHL